MSKEKEPRSIGLRRELCWIVSRDQGEATQTIRRFAEGEFERAEAFAVDVARCEGLEVVRR